MRLVFSPFSYLRLSLDNEQTALNIKCGNNMIPEKFIAIDYLHKTAFISGHHDQLLVQFHFFLIELI